MVDSGHAPDESFRVSKETHSRSLFPKTHSRVCSSPKVNRKKVQSWVEFSLKVWDFIFQRSAILLLNPQMLLVDEGSLFPSWTAGAPKPHLPDWEGFEIFDSILLKAVASFSSGMETITVSHTSLSVLWNSCAGGALFLLLFSFNSQKTGKFTKKLFNCLKWPLT